MHGPATLPGLAKAAFRAFFVYDVADTIDLERLRTVRGEGVARAPLQLRREAASDFIQYPVVPLIVRLPDLEDYAATVRAKIFDFGVVAIRISIPFSGSWEEYGESTRRWRSDPRLEEQARAALGPMVLIALVVGTAAAAFAYTAGWFSPERLTAKKVVDAFAPPGGAALGHRRNHVKGICFTGIFEANGAGSSVSEAPMFSPGQYPAIGRFNLATADIKAADATVRVRGMGLQIAAPGGQIWRMAMIGAPFFPVSTPQGLFESTHCRSGRSGNTSSANSAAVSAMRRPPQEGQNPRFLQLNATSFSA